MKLATLIAALALLVSGCTITPESLTLIPEQNTDPDIDFVLYSDQEFLLYDSRGLNITIIEMSDLQADEWLYVWATEALARDSSEGGWRWSEPWQKVFTWTYANIFANAERRCTENRTELSDVIEKTSQRIRFDKSMSSIDIGTDPYRLRATHALVHDLSPGDSSCSLYLSELPISHFAPVFQDAHVHLSWHLPDEFVEKVKDDIVVSK